MLFFCSKFGKDENKRGKWDTEQPYAWVVHSPIDPLAVNVPTQYTSPELLTKPPHTILDLEKGNDYTSNRCKSNRSAINEKTGGGGKAIKMQFPPIFFFFFILTLHTARLGTVFITQSPSEIRKFGWEVAVRTGIEYRWYNITSFYTAVVNSASSPPTFNPSPGHLHQMRRSTFYLIRTQKPHPFKMYANLSTFVCRLPQLIVLWRMQRVRCGVAKQSFQQKVEVFFHEHTLR